MISNCKKNCMGTISFDGKFGKMRKSQDFIVYPISGECTKIHVQAKSRWAEIDLDSCVLTLSANHTGHAGSNDLFLDIIRGKAEKITLPKETLEMLLSHIRGTSAKNAGDNGIIQCDNSGAHLV